LLKSIIQDFQTVKENRAVRIGIDVDPV